MKLLCIGRNYVKHIEELGNEKPDAPIIFLKPDSAIIRNNDPFYYPDFSNDIHYEVELLVKIKKVGKCIPVNFAHQYYDEIGLGVDFTARDLQTKAKNKGLPWDLAKGFNGAAPISNFISKAPFDLRNINFSLNHNGKTVQQGNAALMLWPIDEIIAYISQFITLKKGDIIFTGTPEGVGPVTIGDRMEGFIENHKMLDFEIK
ncbi:MAG: fumarylacetoacetate hydrolase family protein [Flammeovirgaceae bacterium]|jgi:acylpyruvate hydrolase|nr:fumarylacetoacetate hydrolase family protein [Flammeovirgaceae bacterium]|tara:strand:+ start:22261 stop:22869 length:609 start_codon:yes stop_codon:yes gene_type:complete